MKIKKMTAIVLAVTMLAITATGAMEKEHTNMPTETTLAL